MRELINFYIFVFFFGFRFEQLLRNQIASYVEIQLLSKFGDTVKFVQSVDFLLSNSKEDDSNNVIILPSDVDLVQMEAVVSLLSPARKIVIIAPVTESYFC